MLDLKLILTVRCEEASRLASDALDRRLTLSERIAVRAHTWICRSCRRFHTQLAMLREFLKRMPKAQRDSLAATAPRLSDERRLRIERLLAESARNEGP